MLTPARPRFSLRAANGATAEVRVASLNSDGRAVGGPGLRIDLTMPAIAPAKIADLTIVQPPNDGRHVTFRFSVPASRGSNITHLIIRRNNASAPMTAPLVAPGHDYIIMCPFQVGALAQISCASIAQSASSTTATAAEAICYPALTCEPGRMMTATVGSNLFPGNAWYIMPTLQYSWSAIALNGINAGCNSDDGLYGSCDGGSGAWGWSHGPGALMHTQPIASPDRAPLGAVGTPNQTQLALSWSAPVSNGAAVSTYRQTCEDQPVGNYLVSTWRQADTVQHTPANTLSATMMGLTPGTTYLCRVSSNNTAGGFFTSHDATFQPPQSTQRALPDPVVNSTMACITNYDFIYAGTGQAPDGGLVEGNAASGGQTGSPAMTVTVRWTVPRPNDALLNAQGPNLDYMRGPLGSTDSVSSPAAFSRVGSTRSATAPAAVCDSSLTGANGACDTSSFIPSPVYLYSKAYLFQVMPYGQSFNPLTSPWAPPHAVPVARLTCTTGNFRPYAPIVSILGVLDRKVTISFTTPASNGQAVSSYIYQLCAGWDCAVTVKAITAQAPAPGITTSSWIHRRVMCDGGSTLYRTWADGCNIPANQTFTIDLVTDSGPHGSMLEPNVNYSLIVRAENGGTGGGPTLAIGGGTRTTFGTGFPSKRVTFTTQSVPSTPIAINTTSRSIKWSWLTYSGANNGYFVTLETRNQTGGVVTFVQAATGLTTTFMGLTPSMVVTCRVQARVGAQTTGYSFPSNATTLAEAPDAPTAAPTYTDLRTTNATVSWLVAHDNGLPLTNYTLELTTSTSYAETFRTVVPAWQTSFQLHGLMANVPYLLKVSASNILGQGPFSAPMNVMPCDAAPRAPQPPTKLSATNASLAVLFGPPRLFIAAVPAGTAYTLGAPITNWRIQYRNLDVQSAPVTFTLGTAGTTAEVLGLEPGRPYQLRIAAYNSVLRQPGTRCPPASDTDGDGWGPYSEWSAVMSPNYTPPMAPEAVVLNEAQGYILRVGWLANFDNGDNITSYTVYTNAMATPFVLDRQSPNLISLAAMLDIEGLVPTGWSVPAVVSQVQYSNLIPNTPYWFQVSARNSAGDSPRSPLIYLNTSVWVPERIEFDQLSAPSRTDASIAVRWVSPRDNGMPIQHYELRMRCTSQSVSANPGPGATCPYADANNPSAALGGGRLINAAIQGNVFVVTGLQQALSYEFSVRAYNALTNGLVGGPNGWSPYSLWVPFSTSSTPPAPPPPDVPEPPNLAAARVYNQTTSGFIVEFPVAEANGGTLSNYSVTVVYSTAPNANPNRRQLSISTVTHTMAASSSPSVSFTSLPSGANCTISVQAQNEFGWSVPATFADMYFTLARPRAGNAPRIIDQPLPGLPRSSTLHVVWDPPFAYGSVITSYTLIADGVPRTLPVHPNNLGGSSQFVYAGLDPGTRHNFSVAATNECCGKGAFSATVLFETSEAPPEAPPLPTVECFETPQISCLITLHVTAVPGIFDAGSLVYQLEETTSSTGTLAYRTNVTVGNPNCADSTPALEPCGWPAIRRVRETTLNYFYRVRALNVHGWSLWSPTATVQNSLVGRPPEPTGVVVSQLSARGLTATFAVDDAGTGTLANSSFTISVVTTLVGSVVVGGRFVFTSGQLPLSNTAYCTRVGTGFQCTYVIAEGRLSPDTMYLVQAITTNSFGSSGMGLITNRTLRAPPDAPSDLRVTNVTGSVIQYEWTAPVRPEDGLANGYPLAGYLILLVGTPYTSAPPTVIRQLLGPSGAVLRTLGHSESLADGCTVLLNMAPALPNATVSSSLRYTATGLPDSTPFRADVFGCNAMGPSSSSACASFVASAGCDSTMQPPSHTTGVPPQPSRVISLEDPFLEGLRIHSLFLRWNLPFAWHNPDPTSSALLTNGYPILETQLCLNGAAPISLMPDVTAYNTTGQLPPATQFSAVLRWRNERGWGAWSNVAWMTTLPTVPERPPAPACGGQAPDGSITTTAERLVFNVGKTSSTNGQPILQYEVRLVLASSTYAGVVVFNETLWHEETPPALSSFARGRVFGLVSSDMALPLEMALDAGVHFHAMARAENNLGWSGWSASSEACSVTSKQFNPLWIYLILGAVVLALILCMYCIYKSNLGKILAPNLRKREKREVIGDFVSSEMTPMEEQDPELVINPIFVHKMKRERERQRHAKVQKGGTGKSGGLARLGLNLTAQPKGPVDPKKLDMMGVDRYLERDEGILDTSKQLTALEREEQQRKLQKAGKHAANKSQLHAEDGKKQQLQRARDDARAAGRAGGEARAAQEMEMARNERYDHIEASYASRGANSSMPMYTTAL